MSNQCGTCRFYRPIPGEPLAGYCEFLEFPILPFWMDGHINELRKLRGSDVVPSDGVDCDAWSALETKL